MTGNTILNTIYTQGINDSFGLSVGAEANPFDGLYIEKTASSGFRGLRAIVTNEPGGDSTSVLYGTSVDLTAGNGGANLTAVVPGGIVGHRVNILYFGTGTATAATGLYVLISSDGGAGTLSTAYGVLIDGFTLGVGAAITNAVGIAVENQTQGTNNINLLLGTHTPPSGTYSIYNSSTYANYFAGTTTVNKSGHATTTTQGIALENSTAATAIVTAQYSPALDFIGHGWRTSGAADRNVRLRMEFRPTGGTPIGTLAFMTSIDTGTASWTDRMTLNTSGLLTTTGGVSTTTLTASSLTSGRVPVVSTSGLLIDYSTMTYDGNKLTLTTNGNTGGIACSDVAIYRSAADVWTAPDSLWVTPPTSTITSGSVYGIFASITGTPGSSSTARYFGMSFDAYVTGAQNLTDSTGGLTGFQAVVHANGTGTITAAAAAIFSGDTSSTQTITTLNQVYILGLDVTSGATIVTFNGLRVDGPRSSSPGGTVTTANWIKLQPRTFSAGTMTTGVGIDVFSAGNMNAHGANGQTRLGIDIGAMPSPGAFTGTTTAAIRIQGTGGSRDAILFSDVRLYRNTTTTLYCDQKFETVSLKVGTSSTVGQALTASDTAGNVGFTSIVNKHFINVALCSGLTPSGTGADIAEFTIPYSPRDGTTSLTYNVRRIDFRVNVAGGAPSITLEKYTGTGAFSATTIGTVTLGSGAYEGSKTSSFTTSTLTSGDKVRFNVGTLASATGWTIQLLLEAT